MTKEQPQPVRVNPWLLPLSWIYSTIVFFRNKFFDWGIFKQEEFDIPVVCIGNITVGGTGKTPHTEYIINALKDKYRIGVLSRGYKRKSKGFVLATPQSTSHEIGDESFQIKRKFPDVIVAVDANRRRGIRQMLELENPPEIILLDDGFQHRYVKPSYTIILSDYHRPVYEDAMLPAGRLRQPVSALREANTIIVTKCPADLQPIDFRIISHDINVFPYQDLYFTRFEYNKYLLPVFAGAAHKLPLEALESKYTLLVTGIASPKLLMDKLAEYTSNIDPLVYPDHHNFTKKDIKRITSRFEETLADDKIIIVTEKDAMRLVSMDDISDNVKAHLYYLPIEVVFMDKENDFIQKIDKHVTENQRNRRLYKK
ncbi:tetraacyldisaccharide 4'-kinase [Dysgonomonas sp. 511]|uniref:tetraacyldisaccharide 4'-kinase n=1 Tax=Dysgonomonas sp. 511 TaxID=2302930 RepID=UPI0013D0BDAE|nr:tetraacyldisaccharide 4'-kinase [Dysgonomonas sp. 511]NDV78460.1 tetraacyldisaccharide 4'-kinase [Dysgonomonas sp. 511]